MGSVDACLVVDGIEMELRGDDDRVVWGEGGDFMLDEDDSESESWSGAG